MKDEISVSGDSSIQGNSFRCTYNWNLKPLGVVDISVGDHILLVFGVQTQAEEFDVKKLTKGYFCR